MAAWTLLRYRWINWRYRRALRRFKSAAEEAGMELGRLRAALNQEEE